MQRTFEEFHDHSSCGGRVVGRDRFLEGTGIFEVVHDGARGRSGLLLAVNPPGRLANCVDRRFRRRGRAGGGWWDRGEYIDTQLLLREPCARKRVDGVAPGLIGDLTS